MKLSRNFLSDYIKIDDIPFQEIADKMTEIGNEYASCNKLIPATNLVIGKVLECVNHPDSNHLHICQVDVGFDTLKIVCGAPNVREGLKVIVALPGAILPEITIKKSIIRGVESNGMLCSLAELGLEKKYLKESDYQGICELSEDAKIGKDPISYLQLDDEVIDFELTSNRGDLLSVMGMAYEIGAIYNKKVEDIDLTYSKISKKMNFDLQIKTSKCPLFLAKRVENIVIKESPNFIKNRLIASGIRPINNIVDISNYVMLETGQPLHFYDADRLGNTLIVRDALDGEKLVTLDNQERFLCKDDIVIANQNEIVGLAGVMGGLSTEVEYDSKNILIEAAIFDSISVRLTSKKIIRSEASNRFEKGIDPKRTYMAIERSCHLLEKYADATIIDDIKVYDKISYIDKVIEITTEEINHLLGTNISTLEIKDIFKKLNFETENIENKFKVKVPSRRLDISIKEDLIEEVARLYGIDNIIGSIPILKTKSGTHNKFIRTIRHKLVELGLNETLSYTLIPKEDVYKYTLDKFEPINVLDPMSEERTTLRYSLISSLMKIYEYNSKRNNKDICLFEISSSFSKMNNEYVEKTKLACLMTGTYYDGIEKTKVDFYHLKGVIENLLDTLGYQGRYSFLITDFPKEFHPYASAVINLNGINIGYLGRVHPSISKDSVYVMEIDLDILKTFKAKKTEYVEVSKYPNIVKDIAFVVDNNLTNEELKKAIKREGGKLLTNIELFDVYKGNNLEENKKSLAYNLTFNDPTKTLTDEEVMHIFNKIIDNITKKFNCVLRDK